MFIVSINREQLKILYKTVEIHKIICNFFFGESKHASLLIFIKIRF